MRILLAALIWVLFIGGLLLHISGREKVPAASAEGFMVAEAPSGQYTLEVTPGFTAAYDPFALTPEGEGDAPLLVVRMGERELMRVEEEMAAGTPITLSPVPGLSAGENELFLSASPPLEASGKSYALRVRILEGAPPAGGGAIAEKTLWSPPGGAIGGTFAFTIAADVKRETEEHANH